MPATTHSSLPGGLPTHAVLLLMNGILASSKRSVLAPAISRSEKWSRAAARALRSSPSQPKPNASHLGVAGGRRECASWAHPHPMVSQNLIMPAANPWQVWDRFWIVPRGMSYLRETMCIGISPHRSRSWSAR